MHIDVKDLCLYLLNLLESAMEIVMMSSSSSSSFRDSEIIDPLHAEYQSHSEDCFSSELSEIEDDHMWDRSSVQPIENNKSQVLNWTVDCVKAWLQENVPLGNDRMQECLRSFQAKAVDGLTLLTLVRTHPACAWMNDFDWLLLKAARKKLISGSNCRVKSAHDPLCAANGSTWTIPRAARRKMGSNIISPPASPDSFRLSSSCSSGTLPSSHSRHSSLNSNAEFIFPSQRKRFSFPKITWSSDTSKDEQIDSLVSEVQSLRGEIVSAEERETTLHAQVHHLDETLRTCLIAEYLYTRTRWVSPMDDSSIEDDAEVDDWLQRFVVLQGSSIFFYVNATDLRPQGTIPLDDIVAVGVLPVQIQCHADKGNWFSFHVTTCHGLQFECCTRLKVQMDSWLTLLGVGLQQDMR